MEGVDDSAYYNRFNKHGIPALGKPMDLVKLTKFKYHIDIGGGGGEKECLQFYTSICLHFFSGLHH